MLLFIKLMRLWKLLNSFKRKPTLTPKIYFRSWRYCLSSRDNKTKRKGDESFMELTADFKIIAQGQDITETIKKKSNLTRGKR